jgi:pimeloyl-ACP methyl ester carboxylesterase
LSSKNREELDEVDIDPLKITSGSVKYYIDNDTTKTLSYYHCGPLPSSSSAAAAAAHSDKSSVDDSNLSELVLLHGAAFTKEEWKTSNIIQMLCEINNEEDEGDLSILALDLPVTANGRELGLAFDSLVLAKVLTGRPVTIVTPSASGKSVLSLGEMKSSSSGSNSELLTRIIKAWIPIASFGVLTANETTLVQYKIDNISILSIHGNKDEAGKKVTERLKVVCNARGIELNGQHPVYLDSPEEFVQEVMQFLDVMNL